MPDTFGKQPYCRRTDTGRAHTARQAQDAASFDHHAPAPAGCFMATLALALATIAAILGVLLG